MLADVIEASEIHQYLRYWYKTGTIVSCMQRTMDVGLITFSWLSVCQKSLFEHDIYCIGFDEIYLIPLYMHTCACQKYTRINND